MKRVFLYLLAAAPCCLHAQFDGIVGMEACKAIHCDDARIIEWALTCEITRGYQDIAIPQDGRVFYGQESHALGRVEDGNTGDVVSLGDSGVAILSFQTPVVNGDGYDFAVFENALNDIFLELAFVEVSSDGVHYFRFPSTSNTPADVQIGSAGSVDATFINNLAGKYRVGWGTPFDLEELDDDENLDKNNIRYVKLIDVIGTIDPQYASYDANVNIINDPYPTSGVKYGTGTSGFDLAGAGVMNNRNNQATSVSEHNKLFVSAYPNPCRDFIYVHANGCDLSVFSALGQKLHQQQLTENTSQIDMSKYPDGIYFIFLQNNTSKECLKIVKQ